MTDIAEGLPGGYGPEKNGICCLLYQRKDWNQA